MKYHIMPLGCQMNVADSQRVESVLLSMGYQKTEVEEEASIIGIIACSVRQKSIDRVYGKINNINKRKNNSNLITFVSGCILKNDRKNFAKLFDFVIDMSDIMMLPAMIKEYGVVSPLSNMQLEEVKIVPLSVLSPISIKSQKSESNKKQDDKKDEKLDKILSSIRSLQGIKAPSSEVDVLRPQNENIDSFWNIKPSYVSQFIGFIPIQNGCDKFCSFCAVPFTRGREVSRSPDSIESEFRAMLDAGYKSITLLGQNVNSYGHDIDYSFEKLLDRLGDIADNHQNNDVWIYFTSPHPKDYNVELLNVIARHKTVAKMIHIPLQSGDDKLLKKMNREYDMKKYSSIIKDIRQIVPTATIFTDIIVGFSSETEAQFQNSINAVHELKFNFVYAAIYSKRYGARAFRWKDDVTLEEKNRRFHELTNAFRQTAREYNETLKNQTIKVLITSFDRKNDCLQGENEGKIAVRITNTKDEALVGKFVSVLITDIEDLSIRGQVQTS